MSDPSSDYEIVVPTIGRPSLGALLDALAAQRRPVTGRVVLVDDRRPGGDHAPLLPSPAPAPLDVEVLRAGGRGPAAARNAGLVHVRAPWVVFLDDDVVPPPTWSGHLAADLAAADRSGAVASQGRLHVPLPSHRRPTDWERNVAGLERACWPTADMAVRAAAIRAVGGFDEGFPRAYREDADLALRLMGSGGRLEVGRRVTCHPVRPAPWTVSLRLQRGNRDDARMRRLHGRAWRQRAGAPRGTFPRHAAAVALLGTAGGLRLAGRRDAARGAGACWALLTAQTAYRRIAPGPRTPREVAVMAATSLAIPPLAVWHRVRGEVASMRDGAAR